MKNIILDETNNKLKISNGKFVFTTTDKDYIDGKVSAILQMDAGEDIDDTVKGIAWQQIMFNELVSTSDASSEVRRNLLAISGITEVISLDFLKDENNMSITAVFVFNNELVEVVTNA